jgi:ketosteroid isomerase-like protein
MKNLFLIIPLVILLCFAFGCQDKEAMAELEEMKAQAELEEQNKAIVLRLFEELDKKNFGIFKELCSPDAKLYATGSFEPITVEEVASGVPMTYEAFPDYAHSVKDVIAKGDKVAIRLNCSGTHESEFMGIPATGNTIEFGELGILQIKEGKIVKGWFMEDVLGLMQQLGMELKPKEAEK